MNSYLFDRLSGEFINGKRLSRVPKEYHGYLSTMGYLQSIFNTWQGNVSSNPDYGVPMFDSTFVETPKDTKERGKVIHKILLEHVPDFQTVRVGLWDLHKRKFYLRCVVLCRLKNRELYKYRINFIGNGAHTVEPWSGKYI